MRIRIIQLGRFKDKELASLAAELTKRLGAFSDLKIDELKDQSPSKSFSKDRCIEEEGEKILAALSDGEFVIALDERGREFSSEEFASKLGSWKDNGRALTFVTGGAFGLSAAVRERADLVLSLSKMTFTHQMVRPILLEQIYRAFCIIAGKEYHH
jgi:23S rRNA (pseudouridine1915-N3)-methyltransferase